MIATHILLIFDILENKKGFANFIGTLDEFSPLRYILVGRMRNFRGILIFHGHFYLLSNQLTLITSH
jgi:hypothetical protein